MELTVNILEQIISHMKASLLKNSPRLDKTTDVSNCSQLIAVMRPVQYATIKENIICVSVKN